MSIATRNRSHPKAHLPAEPPPEKGDFGDLVRCIAAFTRSGPSNPAVVDRLNRVYGCGRLSTDEKVIRSMSAIDGVSGGVLVGEGWSEELLKLPVDEVPFLARCRPVEMGAPTHTVPALKQSGRNAPAGYSAADANIQVGYESELADLSENEDTAEFFGMVLRSRRLVAYLTAPNNLVADAPTGWADLVQHVRESIARKREHDYLFGDGVGVPLGVWKAPATITVPRAASGQIRLEDAAALIGSFLPMAYMKSMWLVHTKTLERIVTLKDASGASAFMDLSDAGGEGSPAGKFLNRPLFVSERAPLPGDRGDLALLAPSCYLAGVRKTNGQAVEIAVGTHQQFDEDVLQLKVKIRHDGQPQLSEPFRLADGSNTEVSPFVLLGA